jgi:chromosome segregation ATPase
MAPKTKPKDSPLSRPKLLELVAKQDAELRALRDRLDTMTLDRDNANTRANKISSEVYALKRDNAQLETRHTQLATENKRLSDIHTKLEEMFRTVRYSR